MKIFAEKSKLVDGLYYIMAENGGKKMGLKSFNKANLEYLQEETVEKAAQEFAKFFNAEYIPMERL